MSAPCPCSSGNLAKSCVLRFACSRQPAQTVLLSRFGASSRAWRSLVSGGRASPSLLHLCALLDGSPGGGGGGAARCTHSPLELQKPPPVNSSINNLCLSVSLPADCCLCACKIQLGCSGLGRGRGRCGRTGGGVVRGGPADITACQGDISFAMNHGPEEERDRRARQQHFSSFPPMKKTASMHCSYYKGDTVA